LKEMTEIYKED